MASTDKRLIAYRDFLDSKVRAYSELSIVTREGERYTEDVRSKAYKDALETLKSFFPDLKIK